MSMMTSILFFSLLLATPLPLAALDGGGTAQEKAAKGESPRLAALFPEPKEIDPAMKAEAYREFDRDTLYEFIDGGAEAYLDMGFVRAGTRDYAIPLDGETWIALEIYDMGRPRNAFGIFSQERDSEAPAIQAGAMGCSGEGTLSFWSRRFYVKIRADGTSEAVDRILRKTAAIVNARVGDPGKPPPELVLFPARYRISSSERYVARNLLGEKGFSGFSCLFRKGKEGLALYLCFLPSGKGGAATSRRICARLGLAAGPKGTQGSSFFDDKLIGRGLAARAGGFILVGLGLSGEEVRDVWRIAVFKDFLSAVRKAASRKKSGAGRVEKETGEAFIFPFPSIFLPGRPLSFPRRPLWPRGAPFPG